jgi:hypothetical protein
LNQPEYVGKLITVVTDTGEGMEKKQKLKNMKNLTDNFEGFDVARKLTQLVGGSPIGIKSEIGKGT